MSFDLVEYFSQHASDAEPGELTDEYRDNAADLLPRVDALFDDLGIPQEKRIQASGWRPKATNAATSNAAAHSNHMTGNAIDCQDRGNTIEAMIDDDLLTLHGLYRESPDSTRGWVHLQNCPPKSGRRTFQP